MIEEVARNVLPGTTGASHRHREIRMIRIEVKLRIGELFGEDGYIGAGIEQELFIVLRDGAMIEIGGQKHSALNHGRNGRVFLWVVDIEIFEIVKPERRA